MKSYRTLIFAVFVFVFAAGVYFLDYKKSQKEQVQKLVDTTIIKFQKDQINLIEVHKKNEKIVLQKNEQGWVISEPIQDKADTEQINQLIDVIVDQKWIAIAKESPQLQVSDLVEYGLDQPLASLNVKNNLGQSIKISVGTQKNFEGNSYLRIEGENRVLVGQSIWFNKAENQLVFYRDKRLYRDPLSDVTGLKVKSLSETVALKRVNGQWLSVDHDHTLDQNKVREILKKLAQSLIVDYVFDGEPSQSILEDKGLVGPQILNVEISTRDSNWSALIGLNEKENAIFALTDRPTRLVKMDPELWETVGNLTLDSLRDRVSLTRFNLDQAKKLYMKINGVEMNFVKSNETWSPAQRVPDGLKFDEVEFNRALKRLHDIEISEFIDKKIEIGFKGQDMLILKAETGNLVFQINWGPEFKMKKNDQEKSYYFARTHLSSSIFALDKEVVDQLGFNKALSKIDDKAAKASSGDAK